MQKTLDTTWEFEDFNSKCRLRVYENPGQLSVVIVTELAGNLAVIALVVGALDWRPLAVEAKHVVQSRGGWLSTEG